MWNMLLSHVPRTYQRNSGACSTKETTTPVDSEQSGNFTISKQTAGCVLPAIDRKSVTSNMAISPGATR